MNYTGFPTNYNPIGYAQPITPMMQAPQTTNFNSTSPNNTIVWVQGEAGAKAYPVAAGTSLLLMDSESRQFYIKSTDQSGMPMPLRTFTYEEVVGTISTSKDVSNYITREEFEKRISEITVKPVARAKKEVKEDE